MARPATVPAPSVTRCTGCGSWCWRIDDHGCPTCKYLDAYFTIIEGTL